ncbi:MAG: hypothetical protein AB1714_28755 [Acidobacteriota bacterium]
MNPTPILVVAYAGCRGLERPHVFFLEQRRIEVLEIVSRWVQEEVADRRQRRFFVVRGDDGAEHTLWVDVATSEWYRVG